MASGHHTGQHQASPRLSWELQVRVQQRRVAVRCWGAPQSPCEGATATPYGDEMASRGPQA